jgi:hypothetical protein
MRATVLVSIKLEQDGRSVAIWKSPVANVEGDGKLSFQFVPRNLTYEVATIVIISVEVDGVEVSALRWLSVIASLRVDARQRNINGAVKRMCEEVFQGNTAHLVAGAIGRFLAGLSSPFQAATLPSVPGKESSSNEESEFEVTNGPVHRDDFVISDADLTFLKGHGRAISKTVMSLSATLRGLFIPRPEDIDADDEDADTQDSNGAGSRHDGRDEDRVEKLIKAESLLEELHTGFVTVVEEVLTKPIEPAFIKVVLGLLEGVIAYVRFRHRLVEALAGDEMRGSIRVNPHLGVDWVKRAATMALSLDGIYAGGYLGWLVKARLKSSCHEEMDRITSGIQFDALTMLTANAAILYEKGENVHMADSILLGYWLVRSGSRDSTDERSERLFAILAESSALEKSEVEAYLAK